MEAEGGQFCSRRQFCSQSLGGCEGGGERGRGMVEGESTKDPL